MLSDFQLWLKAAYHYYWLDDPILPDAVWDQLGQEIKSTWDFIDDPDKSLIDTSSFNSLHYIKRTDYPKYCKEENAE